MRMLAPAAYQVPAKEDKEKSKKAEGGLRSKGTLDATSGETEVPSSEDEGEEEGVIPSPHGKKRTASEDLEVERTREGRYPCQMARVWKTMLSHNTSVRTSPSPNRK